MKPPVPGGDGFKPIIIGVPIEFGAVNVLSSHTKDGSVSNPEDDRGNLAVRILAVEIVSDNPPSPFSVRAGTCAGVLVEGAACHFKVTFSPGKVGKFTASVGIEWEYAFYADTGYWNAAFVTGAAKQLEVGR
ncbi:hypothetical protein [Kribbella sp. NPDC049227]|uniref:hypothetical protein n=1 Tax=Kribbella sp. NPDC049227 TaxID=3364113 RepID=UPI003715185D